MKRYKRKPRRYVRLHRLDPSMIGWIKNTARRNFWRVSQWYELRDLIQDGYLVYARCNITYAHIRSQPHFMALFKRAFNNHIHNLAKAKERTVDAPITLFISEDGNVTAALDTLAGAQPEEATFRVLLNQLPTELKNLIMILVRDARNIPLLRGEDRTRETTNEYLCRIANLNPVEYDIRAMLRAHFYGEPIRIHQGLTFWL